MCGENDGCIRCGINTGSVKNKSGKGKGGAQVDTEIEGNYLYILIVFLSSFNLLKVYSLTFQSFIMLHINCRLIA